MSCHSRAVMARAGAGAVGICSTAGGQFGGQPDSVWALPAGAVPAGCPTVVVGTVGSRGLMARPTSSSNVMPPTTHGHRRACRGAAGGYGRPWGGGYDRLRHAALLSGSGDRVSTADGQLLPGT